MTTDNHVPTTIDEISPKMELKGTVKKIDLYGALVDIGVGRLGLLHISQLSEGHVKNVTDVLNEGDEITVWVQDVDRKKGRINLTMIKPPLVSWKDIESGGVFKGTVVRVEKFGAFVDIGAERPGLVHVSELAKGYVGDPSEVVSVGDEIDVKVIKYRPPQAPDRSERPRCRRDRQGRSQRRRRKQRETADGDGIGPARCHGKLRNCPALPLRQETQQEKPSAAKTAKTSSRGPFISTATKPGRTHGRNSIKAARFDSL